MTISEPGCQLYCTAYRQVLVSHLDITKLFNDILFAYYTLDSQVSLSSSMGIKKGLFFFLTFCCITAPISGIINYYYVMESRKTKKSGENKNRLRKMYPINHEKFWEQQS